MKKKRSQLLRRKVKKEAPKAAKPAAQEKGYRRWLVGIGKEAPDEKSQGQQSQLPDPARIEVLPILPTAQSKGLSREEHTYMDRYVQHARRYHIRG